MLKLLIVEDDYMTLEGIVKIVPWQELGITQLEKADDGMNALEIAERFTPHIVLSDICMPRMNGIEFASKLREIEPECKIIFMSAYTDREYYKSAIKLKAISFIEKPIDVEEVKSAIQNAVNLCREDSEKLDRSIEINRTLQSSLPFIRSELVMFLISRDVELSKIKQTLKLLSLDIPEDSDFVTVIIRIIDTLSEGYSPDENIQSNILDIIGSLISQGNFKGIFAFKDIDHIVIHLYSQSDKKNLFLQSNLVRFCITMYEILKGNYNVSIASGKVVHGIVNIYESYSTAVLALQKIFYCICYPFICYAPDFSQPYQFENKQIETFAGCLSKKDRYNLILLVKQLSSNLKCHPNTLVNTVKDFYFRLLLQIIKSAESENIKLIDTEKSKGFLWEMVSKFNYLIELENYVISKIEIYFKLLEEKSRYSSTISGILNYINTHYQERTLSIMDISEHAGLSSTYICVLFKEETGVTINRYITEFRMEKSKDILKDKSLKVADIAKKVGYQEGDYFAKLFRKIEGLSPSEYRERFIP